MMTEKEDDIDFVSKLDEETKKKAKRELNELNDTDRILAVQSFRQWILQQKWLKTPTDFGFLLRFLRVRKFSQLGARSTLENYWTSKTKTPEWFRNVDPCEPILQEIIKTGFYAIPRQLDKYGRRILLQKLARLDLNDIKKKWGVANVFRAITLICDWANRDEYKQVNGIVVIFDNTDVTMSHMITLFNQDNCKRIMQYYQMILHGRSLTKLYDEIGMFVLPEEYLPDDYEGPSVGTCDQIVDDMLADMMSDDFRSYIKNLSSDKYGVDIQERMHIGTLEDSFRKLNIE